MSEKTGSLLDLASGHKYVWNNDCDWECVERSTSPIAELGKRFDDCRGERTEGVQLLRDDGLNDFQVQAGIFMHGYVAESDHLLHSCGEIGQ